MFCSWAEKECFWLTIRGTSSYLRKISVTSNALSLLFPSQLAITRNGSDASRVALATTCDFEYAGWLTEANHLGNVAYRTGRKLEWDAARLYAPDAEPFIRRNYQKGWALT